MMIETKELMGIADAFISSKEKGTPTYAKISPKYFQEVEDFVNLVTEKNVKVTKVSMHLYSMNNEDEIDSMSLEYTDRKNVLDITDCILKIDKTGLVTLTESDFYCEKPKNTYEFKISEREASKLMNYFNTVEMAAERQIEKYMHKRQEEIRSARVDGSLLKDTLKMEAYKGMSKERTFASAVSLLGLGSYYFDVKENSVTAYEKKNTIENKDGVRTEVVSFQKVSEFKDVDTGLNGAYHNGCRIDDSVLLGQEAPVINKILQNGEISENSIYLDDTVLMLTDDTNIKKSILSSSKISIDLFDDNSIDNTIKISDGEGNVNEIKLSEHEVEIGSAYTMQLLHDMSYDYEV